jgi:protein-S-isoprenylcysteine O-methyltransferase Ste14
MRTLIFAAIGWIVFQILLIGCMSKSRSFGKPPISWPALILAKAAIAVSLILMMRRAASGGAILQPFATVPFLLLLLGGTVVMTAAMSGLGRNLRMGLPQDETVLVTSGIYRLSRNPIYLGIFLIMGASLIYAFSWVNLIAVGVGFLLHHRIVLAEERFLRRQFSGYEAYCRQVRRWI